VSNTKEKIFNAALDLFAEVGYRSTSVRDIAEKVGIRESSIYNHYQSKEAILDDILNSFIKDNLADFPNEDVLLASMSQNTVEEFWILGQERFHRFITSPGVEKTFRIMMSTHFYNPRAQHTLLSLLHWYIGQVEIILERMIKKNLIRKVDSRVAATQYVYVILAFLLELFATDTSKRQQAIIESTVNKHIEFFFNNLKQKP